MNGRSAKRQRRVGARQARIIADRAKASGRCPNCGREVDDFAEIYDPGARGARFACEFCSKLMADQMPLIRAERRRIAEPRRYPCSFCGLEPTIERLGLTAVMAGMTEEGLLALSSGPLCACARCSYFLDKGDESGLVDHCLGVLGRTQPEAIERCPRWFAEDAARTLARGYQELRQEMEER